MSTSTSPSAATAELKKPEDVKPIKLRSACNCCFAAKVRCDGNKEGCKRCTEKHLECTYSQSMVGKVVGKRRKRPLPDSRLVESKMSSWNVNIGPVAMPSPTSTHTSDVPNKRNCISNDWTSLISYDGQSPLDFSTCDEQFLNLDLCQDSSSAAIDDSSFILNNGLPTPSMSPPSTQFLSPSDLEACTQQKLTMAHHEDSIPAQYTMHAHSGRQQYQQVEDDETVCLKVLTHLKRFSSQPRQSLQATLSLIHKTNSTIRRILRSRTIRTDYTCHLLMTNIMMHLASIYECVLSNMPPRPPQPKSYPDQEFINECYLTENEQESPSDHVSSNARSTELDASIKTFGHESALLCSSIGDMLKRKPLNGFQTLGRHESALIEIEVRFKHVIASLA